MPSPEIPYVYDGLGTLPQERGIKVRIIVTVEDGPPAKLWMLHYDAGLVRRSWDLLGVNKPMWNGYVQYDFAVPDWTFTFTESNCSCGAGKLPYEDPVPGRSLVRVRTPSWLEGVL